METDSFFWQLLKQLPETLFALIGKPVAQAADYRFAAEEIKKSYRLDGLFVPTTANLPLYFVEVKYQPDRCFYANLFAKVFSYLEANDPTQDWQAVALFANRGVEPKEQAPYRELLASPRVWRIYLDELTVPASAALGLKILKFLNAPDNDAPELLAELMKRAQRKTDCDNPEVVVKLLEEAVVCKYPELSRKEIRRMFQLANIRDTRSWQEAHEEGKAEGRIEEKQEIVLRCIGNGKKPKEIAELLGIPVAEVRRLAKKRTS